jgi:hypothetical protein
MRKLAIIGAAIAAVAALSAIATTMASAAAPELETTKAKDFPIKFTSFSGLGTLKVVGGSEIICEKDKDSGEFINAKEVTDTIDFEKCKAEGIVGAHSLGDPEGTILTTSKGSLCLIKEKDVGILLEPTGPVHIEIPTVATLLIVKGSVTGLITPIEQFSLRFELAFTVTGGKQVPEECEGKKDELLTAKNEGTFEKSTEATTGIIGFLREEVKIVE